MELLSPAGSMKSALAAIKAGADSIYLGVTDIIHQRSRCSNFDDNELKKIVNEAHKNSVKVYVTFNSSYNSENFISILKKIKYLNSLKVDSVIISDIGLIKLIHKKYPQLRINFSVQGQCANAEFALLLKELGVSGIVLDRNVSISEAKEIKRKTGLEVEMFLFGYQCYSQDSICYMGDYFSSEPCNVSCAQKIKFIDGNNDISPKRYFFMKYMSGLKYIPLLVESGIDCVKIEGRQRSSDYVYRVTKVFREAIDYYEKCKKSGRKFKIHENWVKELKFAAFDFEVTDGFFVRNEYKRNIIKDGRLKNKLVYLYDCLYNFLETYNITKLNKEIKSSLKLDRYAPKSTRIKIKQKIEAFK